MPGMGTVVNVGAIILGGILGMLMGDVLKERTRQTLVTCCGVATLFIAISGVMEQMLYIGSNGLSTQGSMMMIISLVAGTLLGELADLSGWLERFGAWIREKSGNGDDATFISAFVTASLTVCVGAMAIVGSIRDGIYLDASILIAKAVLDFVIVLIMTASMGKGAVFSALPVALLQGGVTVLARAISPLMTAEAVSNLSLVGSVVIFCVGVNLVWDKKIPVANMLPALIFAAAWAMF